MGVDSCLFPTSIIQNGRLKVKAIPPTRREMKRDRPKPVPEGKRQMPATAIEAILTDGVVMP